MKEEEEEELTFGRSGCKGKGPTMSRFYNSFRF